MTSLTADRPFAGFLTPIVRLLKGPAKPGFDIGPRPRALVLFSAMTMTLAAFYAVFRGLSGFAPSHPEAHRLAIIIHVATVLPAVPLGGFLLLAPKGTRGHKMLGKVWVALMLVTASAAIFIKSGGSFSFIHLFIPMTFWASYKLVATARRGDMKGHKKEILSLYLGALMIPGIFSFAIPGRVMNVWLFS